MKRNAKKFMKMSMVVLVMAVASHAVWADHHHEAAVKKQIKSAYQLLAEGKYKAFYQTVHPEAIIFGRGGGLMGEFPEGEEKEQLIKKRNEEYENGDRILLTPKHIKVLVNDDGTGAVACFYTEGTVIVNGEQEDGMGRVSVVFVKQDGEWKALHWHVSELENEDND